MRTDLAWTHDSGTHELARPYRNLPLSDIPTAPIFPFYLKPPVTSTYRIRRPLLRFLRSRFARDVRHGFRNRVLPGLGILGVAWASIVLLRGAHMAALLLGVAE